MTTVYENNEVEIDKIGRTKGLDEEDIEEVYTLNKPPAFNPELNNPEVNPSLKQRKITSPSQAEPPISIPEPKPIPEPIKKVEKSSLKLIFFILFAVLIGLVVFYFFLNSSTTDFVLLENIKWQREVYPERYQQNTKSDWILPSGATVISSSLELYRYNEIRHTKEKCSTKEVDVPSHKEYSHTNTKVDNDGTVRKKDIYRVVYKKEVKNYCWDDVQIEKKPEYRTKYVFNIWEWTPLPPLKTSGEGSNTKPKFAYFKGDQNNRVAKKVSTFIVALKTANGKVLEYKVDPKMFYYAKKNFGKNCQVTWNYFDVKNLNCAISR